MSRKFLAIIVFLLVLTPLAALAAFPSPTGFVNDFAGVISPSTREHLESMLTSFERSTGDEIAVVTLPSLEGDTVENVAVQLYQQWGIGKKGKDNGALFLVAPSDRKARIEVGYGLEGVINDALAGRLLDDYVIPRFKAGEMDGGIAAGALAIVKTIATKEGIEFDADAAFGRGATKLSIEITNRSENTVLSIIGKIFLFLIMAYLFIRHPWLLLLFLGSMGRGGGSGGFGGGFGGFGGGLSGGGGASRGW